MEQSARSDKAVTSNLSIAHAPDHQEARHRSGYVLAATGNDSDNLKTTQDGNLVLYVNQYSECFVTVLKAT